MTYREAARRLRKMGCIEWPRRSGGSHRKWYNPATRRMVVLPDWGSRDLKTGTLRAAFSQLGMEWSEFESIN
ncbi:MAG: type II toxin-antitoxin system HicA family toxin [Thermodesulfobacteriota bacterium]